MTEVMIVEDDADVRGVVFDYLQRREFKVRSYADGLEGWAAFMERQPDLVILDRMLPGLSGDQICAKIREVAPELPVIMLTALDEAPDRIDGLERGADDYISKPFALRELQLRVLSLLRRTQQRFLSVAPITVGPFMLDASKRRAWKNQVALSFTAREFDLFQFFLHNPERIMSREEIFREVWGWNTGEASTVTVHVRRLREKIEPEPTIPQYLRTEWGKGYTFTLGGTT